MWFFPRIKHAVHSVACMLARLHILNDAVCLAASAEEKGIALGTPQRSLVASLVTVGAGSAL